MSLCWPPFLKHGVGSGYAKSEKKEARREKRMKQKEEKRGNQKKKILDLSKLQMGKMMLKDKDEE